jgi:hypothetical protein
MTNNHNLFPLPCWAPALRRVPTPLKLLDEAYARGDRVRNSVTIETYAAEPVQDFMHFLSPLPSGRGR